MKTQENTFYKFNEDGNVTSFEKGKLYAACYSCHILTLSEKDTAKLYQAMKAYYEKETSKDDQESHKTIKS